MYLVLAIIGLPSSILFLILSVHILLFGRNKTMKMIQAVSRHLKGMPLLAWSVKTANKGIPYNFIETVGKSPPDEKGLLTSKSIGTGKLLHLQGIRGLAICSVIAFHYFPDHFPNGYLGVDIFFVLSGYLMSMLLSKKSSLDVSTIVDFLYRRIKRITPLYYLVVLITMAILHFCPCTELGNNLLTARSAIWLLSNTNWDTGMGYFEKSGLSHDLFTHTWSLCLEMQFYLLFPFLWWAQIQFSANRRMIILHIISGFSLVLYLMSEERVAFNSVLCRVWQFLLGNMVHYLENSKSSNKAEKPRIDNPDEKAENSSKNVLSMDWIFASLSLVLFVYTATIKAHLLENYSRITTTLLSIVLIHFGKGFSILENGMLVLLGEISYSWYLVHWPMVVIQKMYEHTSKEDMFLGVIASLTAAIVFHYGVEKFYLVWEKMTICVTVLLLFLSCNSLHYYLSHTRFEICQESPLLKTDFSAMSIEERQAYNTNLSNYDNYQILNKGCEFEPSLQSYVLEAPSFEGTCKYKNDEAKGNRTILVMGNSWAANIVPVVFDECKPFFANIYRTSYLGCELLRPNAMIGGWLNCGKREQAYLQTVEKFKPDYLFLTYRYCFFGLAHTEAEWEEIMRVASERLAYIAPFVKEKIFVLRTFPLVGTPPVIINAAMANNTEVNWDVGKLNGFDMATAQKKLDELMRNCPKCEEIDLQPPFMLNGKFTPYDPKYYMAYVTQGTHFSLLGLEKIRPVYTKICRRIGRT